MHSQNTQIKFSPFDGRKWTPGSDTCATGATYRDDNPVTRWNYNPWTGELRKQLDIIGDPLGELIVPPGEDVVSTTAIRKVTVPKCRGCQVRGLLHDEHCAVTPEGNLVPSAHQVKFGQPTESMRLRVDVQPTNPAPVCYEITITHGDIKHTIASTEKTMLERMCVEILRGMK